VKKRKVIKTIVRKKKKISGATVAPDGNHEAYTTPAADFGDDTVREHPNTPEDAMDHYAQASAEADASRLSMAEKNEKENVDSLPATQVDAEEKPHVIDLEPELEDFMDQHFDDRQKFPEEESFQEGGETGVGPGDTEETQQYEPGDVCNDVIAGEPVTHEPAAPDAEDRVPEEDNQSAWKQDDWSYYGYWPYDSWGGSWKSSWDYGYGYYGSWGQRDNYHGTEGGNTVRRSNSVESEVSGFSQLTSVSALHMSLNRLNTPDLEHVKKNDEKKNYEKKNDEKKNDEKKHEKPVRLDDATSPSSSVPAPAASPNGTPGDEMNQEHHDGSDVGTAPSSSNGDTGAPSETPDGNAVEAKNDDKKAAEGEGYDSSD